MLHARDLSKTYDSGPVPVQALRGVSLTVEAGEFVAVCGPSGSGKTTLMSILGLLDTPTTGTYELGGQSLTSLAERERNQIRASMIGMVFQSFHLLETRSVRANVGVGMTYTDLPPSTHAARIDHSLASVGLSGRARFPANVLSGGEQQRVAIARALACSPQLLLADEPTGNLDSATSRNIMGLFLDLRSRGNTVVMITHNPSVAQFADRVVWIEDGVVRPDRGA